VTTLPLVSLTVLRILIGVLGVLDGLIGINVGFGGLWTLGLQGQTRFFGVIDERGYLRRTTTIGSSAAFSTSVVRPKLNSPRRSR